MVGAWHTVQYILKYSRSLKADRPHLRDKPPTTPGVRKKTMALYVYTTKQESLEVPTNKRTDGCYQFHYLPTSRSINRIFIANVKLAIQ